MFSNRNNLDMQSTCDIRLVNLILQVFFSKCPLCTITCTRALKVNLPTSTGSREVSRFICLSESVLISTIIQSRLPLSHFLLNPLMAPTSFSKLSWELSFGDFHLCLMHPWDGLPQPALFTRCPFSITWDKQHPRLFSSLAIHLCRQSMLPPAHTVTWPIILCTCLRRGAVFPEIQLNAAEQPNTEQDIWIYLNVLKVLLKCIWSTWLCGLSFESLITHLATWIHSFVSFAFYYILIALDGRQGQSTKPLLAVGQVICQGNDWTWQAFANGYVFLPRLLHGIITSLHLSGRCQEVHATILGLRRSCVHESPRKFTRRNLPHQHVPCTQLPLAQGANVLAWESCVTNRGCKVDWRLGARQREESHYKKSKQLDMIPGFSEARWQFCLSLPQQNRQQQ